MDPCGGWTPLFINSVRYFAQGFANYFSALAIGKDLRTVCEVMQAALNRVQRWCEDHGFSVNPDKTEMVLFSGFIPIVFFCKELERTNKVKHLGVVLDSKLTWSEHLDQKCKKGYSTILATPKNSG